ncbi:MAG: GGDEF domain-containing protein [Ruminiclostridium sp.]|nr:GGDEF domain-containing protein [Ruminiclostridium sp.]
MEEEKRRVSVGVKMHLFIIITVLAAVLGTSAICYFINVDQIDRYFKNLAYHSAENFAAFVDAEYLSELRECAESDEFQAIRDKAEEDEDEAPIEEYLTEKGLWDRYCAQRELLCRYLHNMEDIKYLYIIVWGPADALYDMYLLDDDDNPIYETGYYEEREAEFYGADPEHELEPTISNGSWGWLCSAYAPVYDSTGRLICHVGCDVGMEDIMAERAQFLTYIASGALAFTVIVLFCAVFFANRVVIKPLNSITDEMKKFRPAENVSYDEAGVLNLNIRSRDEIQELYSGIRKMQTDIIDYLNNVSELQRDKERAENDIREKDEQIGAIRKEAYRDALTGVGSKNAYNNAVNELNENIRNGFTEFALVMADINDLKKINDDNGHKAGDIYIKGCCHIICDVFKHSPVFRIGGDEFVVILRDKDYAERQQRVSEIKAAFEKSRSNPHTKPWYRYSASVGLAECASDDNCYELVFKRADNEMYKEKKAFKETNGSYR